MSQTSPAAQAPSTKAFVGLTDLFACAGCTLTTLPDFSAVPFSTGMIIRPAMISELTEAGKSFRVQLSGEWYTFQMADVTEKTFMWMDFVFTVEKSPNVMMYCSNPVLPVTYKQNRFKGRLLIRALMKEIDIKSLAEEVMKPGVSERVMTAVAALLPRMSEMSYAHAILSCKNPFVISCIITGSFAIKSGTLTELGVFDETVTKLRDIQAANRGGKTGLNMAKVLSSDPVIKWGKNEFKHLKGVSMTFITMFFDMFLRMKSPVITGIDKKSMPEPLCKTAGTYSNYIKPGKVLEYLKNLESVRLKGPERDPKNRDSIVGKCKGFYSERNLEIRVLGISAARALLDEKTLGELGSWIDLTEE